MSDKSPIGQLNGPWSVMLRFLLATYPLVIMWGIWVTTQTFSDIAHRSNSTQYVTQVQLATALSALPSQDWRNMINALASDIKQVNLVLGQNQVSIARIEARLTIQNKP